MSNAQTRGELLRELRQRANMSQADVGEAVGVDAATIGHWEASRRGPGDRLGRLLDALGASSDEKLRCIDLPRSVEETP